jgi:LysM repeat protein
MTGSRVLMLVAALVGVIAVAVVGWRAVEQPPASVQREAQRQTPPASPAPKLEPTPVPAPPAEPQPPVQQPVQPQPQPPEVVAQPAVAPPPEPPAPPATPAPPPAPAPIQPSFDIVRVEPSGDTIIAGRGAPKSRVVLSEGPRVLVETDSDTNGEFVLIPPAFRPGDHMLNLRVGAGAQEALTSLVVSVPSSASDKTLATVVERDQPTRVLSEGGAKPATPVGAVSVRTVEAGEEGAFFASGMGPSGATVRLYLNEAFVADVKTAPDGTWTLRVERGMSPGHYEVRADLVEEGGKVAARAQAPFDYPRQEASRAAAPVEPAPATPAAQEPPGPGVAVVPEIQSVKVVRGDSLWRISQRVLGQGLRYTQIYEANSAQIRDPNRIFPGQVLVTPQPPSP